MTNQDLCRVSAVPARPTNPCAVAAFVLSLFAGQGLVIALMTAAIALVALDQIKQRGERGRALAQFTRAFAIISMTVILVCRGNLAWAAYPLFWW